MKEVTLRIPDKKLDFFMELIKQLGFEIYDESSITEAQKAEVQKRIKTTKPNEMLAWKEARLKFTYKDK